MAQAATVVMEGVKVIQGTPSGSLTGPTLFLNMWKVIKPDEPDVTMASLRMARPGVDGYIIKDLIPELTCPPKQALDKAVAIANRGDVSEVYVNADMDNLPSLGFAAVGQRRVDAV